MGKRSGLKRDRLERSRLRRGRRGAASIRPLLWSRLRWEAWLRWLGVVLALGGIAAGFHVGGQWLLDAKTFPLRHVHLNGELRNLNEAVLRQALGNYLGQSFFMFNINELYEKLRNNPWVEQVTVRRRWPDSVEVVLWERSAFGRWGQDEMVDVNGARFRPAVIPQSASWPWLVGPDGHEMTLIDGYREASAILSQIGLTVNRLVQDQRRGWRLTCDNGVEINLGRQLIEERLRRFVNIYPRALAGRGPEIKAVDLRYPNGFAVRWAPGADPHERHARTLPVNHEDRENDLAARG